MALPDSVQCKLYRAKEHLDQLHVETDRYLRSNPAKLVRQREGSPNEYIGKVVTDTPVPKRIPLIVGDFLQNLRSALDYLVWELVMVAKNTPDRNNMFPICTTPEAFMGQVARHRLDGTPTNAVAEIDALRPYHEAVDPNGHVLAMIDDLCNINKHRRILTTTLYGGRAPTDFATEEIGGESTETLASIPYSSKARRLAPSRWLTAPTEEGRKWTGH
jgi:hypothetical protein